MYKLNTSPLRVLLGLVLLTLFTVPALAAQTPHLAATQPGGTVVTWQPQVEYGQLTLRIDGPAGTFTRVFEPGEVPFFDLATLEGAIDGSYTFELTASPPLDPEVRQMLRAARERGDDLSLERRLRTEGVLPAEPLVLSGYLTVVGGQFVNPGDTEVSGGGALQPRSPEGDGVSSTGGESVRNLSAADQVILDDLIVTGSICVGFDCVNGENFGFDTLKLKENNLRIKFDDTSNSASFPKNDWQITANDSSNGGAEKFSIDDVTGGRTPFTIEASAPSNSLYVDDGGRLGLGTSTPVVDLHVVNGNTPTLRLQQDGSSGFTPQTWDVAGNEANFFIRDVTNGSTLPIRIKPGAGSSSIFIDSDSNVLINGANGTSADAALHVKRSDGTTQVLIEETSGTAQQRIMFKVINNGAPQTEMTNSNTNTTWRLGQNDLGDFVINDTADLGTAELQISTDGTVRVNGTIVHTSSRDFKENFTPLDPRTVLAEVAELPVMVWNFKEDENDTRHVGPTAEDFYGAFGLGKTDKYISDGDTTGIALLAIQGLHAEVQEKNQEIDELKARLEALEKRLADEAESR